MENTNVEHENMSKSDKLVEPSTSELLKEAKQSENGDVDNENVCCEYNVSYEDDAHNMVKNGFVVLATNGYMRTVLTR